MAKSHLKLGKPSAEKRTVTPRRRPNSKLRTREYLTEAEVERLIEAAKGNRYGHRDATMIPMAYRHGLRVSELVDLRWDQIDFDTANLAVRRVKSGSPSTHPIRGAPRAAARAVERRKLPGWKDAGLTPKQIHEASAVRDVLGFPHARIPCVQAVPRCR
jgi:integrase